LTHKAESPIVCPQKRGFLSPHLTSPITAIAIDSYDDTEIIYTGTGKHGVYLSQDSGNTWTSFNQGLKSHSITKLSINKSEPKFLYAGTAYAGVWDRALTNTALPWIPLLLLEE